MSFFRPQSPARVFILCVVVGAGLLVGCSTPEGGSSIPWNRPQTWEHQMPMGINPGYAR
ncbi:MAG: hypothetical protein WCV00_01985 [Verrucomicrobiia bacterium]